MWMKYFPRDQFFFLHIADLNKEVIRTHLKDIANFLGKKLAAAARGTALCRSHVARVRYCVRRY
jgi:hypothetical protein